jgi:hypothetical protein
MIEMFKNIHDILGASQDFGEFVVYHGIDTYAWITVR